MEMRLHPPSDIISNLPEHVIETILVHLPIRDAVRTCVLSHKWRYKWATIPELVFDENSIPELVFGENSILTAEDVTIHMHKLVNFIDRLLLLHKGPLLKFELSLCLVNDSFFDAWILFLSRNGVKELTLKVRGEKPYRFPYSFFSCQAITDLNLQHCILESPSAFKGFSDLKSLNFQSVILSDEVFETIISNCTALERLRLKNLNGCSRLKICGLNLQHFYFDGELTDICFIDVPQLSFVSIYSHNSLFEHVGQGDSCNLVKVLGPLTGLEKLASESYFIQLDEADVTELVGDFWEAQGHLDCSMNHLRVVKVYFIAGLRPDLQFLKFLLVNSPVLEILRVNLTLGIIIDETKTLKELLRFRRASARAEIICTPNF
ncbi:hypothetical protein HHK36_006888 [Tetracentron sinense]|uniref:F-box domain-containing protein n=1 Tax=Tetracentron sinense TaxID=13715 RepID=A0A834ZSI6_TETSI|nr:hypothetical protein HHK36_006888 [Tetracentron sinense]